VQPSGQHTPSITVNNAKTASTAAVMNRRTRSDYIHVVDTRAVVQHPTDVTLFSTRILGLVLSLAIAPGTLGVCAGWEGTPEARVACCSEPGSCPMHKSDAQRSGSQRVITQAEADSCCASAEGDDSTSASSFVRPLAPALVSTAIPALTVLGREQIHTWRVLAPRHAGHVPKHVLLSVFLV